MTVWCLHFPTPGVGHFTHEPSRSAKEMYNRFGRPETLLWLVEALKFDSSIIQKIIDEIKGISKCRSACAIIRKRIPFEYILNALSEIEKGD